METTFRKIVAVVGIDDYASLVARDAKIAGGAAVLSEVRSAVGNKHPGRDLVFNLGRIKLYERHVVAKQRLYMLGVHDGTGKDASAVAQKFFATFELTE
jgi:hypothetical protein